MSKASPSQTDELFQGIGQMPTHCRTLDWSKTTLGAVAGWPQSLRTATQMVLASPFPMLLMWGPELIQIYNDGYRALMGNKHPVGLGQPTQQCWPEVWSINEPIYQRVWAGESVSFEDALYPITRSGQLEDAWFTLAYSPVRTESGQVGGILVTVFDTTVRKLAQGELLQQQAHLQESQQRQTFMLHLSDALRSLTNPAAIQAATTQLLRAHFDTARSYYMEIDEENHRAYLRATNRRDAAPSAIGVFDLHLFEGVIAKIRSGKPLIINDWDERTKADMQIGRVGTEAMNQRQVVAQIAVPILKQEHLVGTLTVNDNRPRAWTENEVGLVVETAERTWAAVERAKAEEALRQSEEKYRILFNSMDEGFSLIELILDQTSKVVDYWHREHNPAFTRMTGLNEVIGKRMSELVPDLEPEWHRMLEKVYHTGEPIRMEYPVQQLGQWYSAYLSRVGKEGSPFIACVYDDITERKQQQLRQQYLLKLSDALRPLSDPLAIQDEACRVLGEHLGVGWTQYTQVDPDRQVMTNMREHRRAGLPSQVGGTWPVDVFPVHAQAWRAGRTLILDDVAADGRLGEGERAGMLAALVGAALSAPLVKDGRLVAIMSVLEPSPRAWRTEGLALLEETAERTWAAVERAKAEEALRQSEVNLSALFRSVPVGVALMDKQGTIILSNDQMLRYLPNGLIPSQQPERSWRWQGYYADGQPVEMANFPGRRAMRGETSGPIEFLYTPDEGQPLWTRVTYFPVPDDQDPVNRFVCVITDIDQLKRNAESLKQSDERKAYLLQLNDALRTLQDPYAIQESACRQLGEFLAVQRVNYADIEADEFIIQCSWVNGVQPITGRGPIATYSHSLLEEYRQKGAIAIADIATDPRFSETERANYARASIAATASVMLLKGERWVASFAAHSARPRAWTELELLLVHETAERTWAAVERAKIEEALRQSEEKYRSLFTLIDEGFALATLVRNQTGGVIDYRFDEINPAFEKQLGLTRSAVVGRLRNELLPPDPAALGLYAQVISSQQFLRTEYYSTALDIWYDLGIFPKETDQFVVIFTDITDRKKAESALYQSEARQRAILESANDYAIFTTDLHQCVTSWNTGAQAMFGYSEAAILHQTVDALYNPDDRQAGIPQLEAKTAIAQGRFDNERWHARQDGSLFYGSGVVTPLRDETGAIMGLLKVMRDLTAQKRAEQALHEADQRKDEFLAMLAHELRNPMSTIRSGLQILSLTTGADEMHTTVAMMNRQTDHLVHMVDDLLDVSRISQGKIELHTARVNLVELVKLAVESSKAQFEKQGKGLQMSLPIVPIELVGDATRLTQVVTNLLTNGARYTGEQGQVWLSLKHQQQEAILEVRDNGIGLRADQLSTIFELFVQVDNSTARSKGGLGLGLTLVKRLVELHGGRVEARSEGLGQGSTFTVHLPTLQAAVERVATPHLPEGDSSSAAGRILVIDDNADAGFTLAMLLKLKGYETHTRTSGRAGLEASEDLQPSAILLDIGMPDLDGYATCRLIREQAWGQAVVMIALTGYGQEEDRQRTREAGFDGHLVKPVDLGALTKLLTDLLDRGSNR